MSQRKRLTMETDQQRLDGFTKNLPDEVVLEWEIIEDLRAALEQFESISAELESE